MTCKDCGAIISGDTIHTCSPQARADNRLLSDLNTALTLGLAAFGCVSVAIMSNQDEINIAADDGARKLANLERIASESRMSGDEEGARGYSRENFKDWIRR